MRPRPEGIKTLRGKTGNEKEMEEQELEELRKQPPPTLPTLPSAPLPLLPSDISEKAADVKSRFHIPIIKVVQSSEWLHKNSRRGRRPPPPPLLFPFTLQRQQTKGRISALLIRRLSPLKPLKVGIKNARLPISIFN